MPHGGGSWHVHHTQGVARAIADEVMRRATVAVPPVDSYWHMNHTQGVERAIEEMAAEQLGVFARNQALELGASRRMLEYRSATGAWPIVLPRVHRIAAVASTRAQAAMAASLWAGPDGLVSHETAGMLWRFDGITTEQTHVTFPATRNRRSGQVVVHRVVDLLPADIGVRGPIAVTTALRTAIDLAGVVVPETLEIAIESALRRGLFTVGQLRWRADALMGPERRGSSELRALLDRHDLGRTDSRWEVATARILESAGYGAPVRQHPISSNGKEVARADLAYPDVSDHIPPVTQYSTTTPPAATSCEPSAGPSSRSHRQPCASRSTSSPPSRPSSPPDAAQPFRRLLRFRS